MLVLVVALPANAFVVVCDVVVDDGGVEDTDFKYFKLSQWLLYSIGVLGLKLRIRLRVSLTANSNQNTNRFITWSIKYDIFRKTYFY